jgi:hypothetical protein
MYTWPRNSRDLRNCGLRANETLWEYIRCFSKKHNELPNVTNTNVINAFTCGMTCKVFIHVFRCEAP